MLRPLMGQFLRFASTSLTGLLTAVSAFAAEPDQPNIFNADMSHPDLAATVTAFENICLPFITHRTDLPQSLNQQHHVKLLSQKGFQFQSRMRKEDQYLMKEAQEAWIPDDGVLNANQSFTVFTGTSTQPLNTTQAILGQTGEIMGPFYIRGEYKTIIRDMDSYVSKIDARQTAILGWNYASQNHPGKSCSIALKTSDFPSEVFTASLIEKDSDWRETWSQKGQWTQCTIDGQDEYAFTAEYSADALSLSIRRNDLYENKLCGVRR